MKLKFRAIGNFDSFCALVTTIMTQLFKSVLMSLIFAFL